jgi:DnaA family protein
MKQLAFEFGAPREPTLENFVAGRNAEVLHHVREIARGDSGERLLYVWGASGSGRTHLLRAAARAAREAGAAAAYLACDAETRFRDGVAGCRFIALDDVDRMNDEAQGALFGLCDRARAGEAVLLVSADVPPARLRMRRDVLTRLAWGLVYEVHGLTDEEKGQALQRRAADRGFALADETLSYLMSRAPRDMPTLLALVDALDRHSLERKRPITLALLRDLLNESAGCSERAQ